MRAPAAKALQFMLRTQRRERQTSALGIQGRKALIENHIVGVSVVKSGEKKKTSRGIGTDKKKMRTE